MPAPTRSPRVIRLVRTPDASGVGVLSITSQSKTQFYVFREIPCEIGGRGFILHRLGMGNVYYVRVGDPMDCSCECMGYLAHGRCKHVQGLLALVGHGML